MLKSFLPKQPRRDKKKKTRCVIHYAICQSNLVESRTKVGNHDMVVLPHINVQYKDVTLEMFYWYTAGSTSQVYR